MRALCLFVLLIGCEPTEDGPKTPTGDSGGVTDSEPAIDTGDPTQDADGDGYIDECDDNNAAIYPGAAEVCDGLDNDCNGLVDDNAFDAATWYADTDGDGFGDPNESLVSCDMPMGFVAVDTDCDDTDARFNPGAIESDCEDPLDYNCDGSVGYVDDDGDGHPACEDCDDNEANVHDSQPEICDGLDNDCNGFVDSDDPNLVGGTTWYADVDGDGHGADHFVVEACEQPDGYVDNSTDCNDLDPLTYPSAAEICDEKDNDCDGVVDEGVGFTWYADSDGDGYGDATSTTQDCYAPPGYSANGDDCNDTDPSAHPGGVEICDAADNDCDGTVDGANALDAQNWYADTDGDGYGDANSSTEECSAPTGHVSDDSDCDDSDIAVHPGATETCNSTDDNCDGTIDESTASDATTWYQDLDGDTYGDSSTSQAACDAPLGFVADATDCNDLAPSSNPAGTEVCDVSNEDEDCDGLSDDSDPEGASGKATYYTDADSDGFGSNLDAGTEYCDPPAALVSSNNDCDDATASTYPGASETCDDVDADCDSDLVDSGDDNCHALATCTDDGTGANYSCDCDTGYTGDGVSSCEIDTFPDSVLLNLTQKSQLNTWASRSGQVWTLCYRKSDDGTSSSTFHSLCDSYSTTFTVADLSTGKLIGGFTTTSWAGSGTTGNSSSFLFSLTDNYQVQHCTGQHGCGTPQYNVNHYGPTFGGGHDWHVAGGMNGGYCNLGHDYACQVGSYGSSTCRNDFCGNYESWTINDIEVWGL